MSNLRNTVAVVTGGTAGIGFAIAQELLDRGAQVVITGRGQQRLDDALAALGPRASGVRADVAISADMDAVFAHVAEQYGQFDTLVANAAAGPSSVLGSITDEDFDLIFSTNVKGVLYTVQKGFPLMRPGGTITIIGSMASTRSSHGLSLYSASKAAIRNFLGAWVQETKGSGIRMNVLSPGPETLTELAMESGAKAVSVHEAARGQELVVVTIPERSVPQLPQDLFAGVPADVAVVDTGNYYPQRDGRIEEIEAGTPESRWVEHQLGRPVIKAFNNILAQHLMELGRPAGAPDRIALPVAGDDKAAKAVVMRLIDELGFDAVDADGLDESWRQQPGTPVYATDRDAEGVRRALSEASPERPPEFRAS